MRRVLLILIIVVVALGGGVGAFLWWNSQRPAVAFVRDAWGDVEQQAPPIGRWGVIDAGAVVKGNEQVRTLDASRAVLILRGAGRLVMSQDTHVEVLPPVVADDGKVRALQIRLIAGAVRVEAAADAEASLELLVGDRIVGMKPGGLLLASVGPGEGEYLISFLDAEGFLVEPGGQRRTVPPNTGVALASSGASAPVSLPGAPEPSNTEDEMRVYASGDPAVAARFDFKKTDAELRLIVSRDAELTDIVADVRGSGTLTASSLAPGTYFWAAATVDPDGGFTGPFTRARRLVVDNEARPANVDEAPSGRIVVGPSGSVFYSGKNLPDVGVDWAGPTSPDAPYNFTLRRGTAVVARARPEASRYTARNLEPGRYRWTAKNGEGKRFKGTFLVRNVTGASISRTTKVNKINERYKVVNVIFQRELPPVEFQWKADARATGGYQLFVERRGKTLLTRKAAVAKTAVRLKAGSIGEGDYTWRVARLLEDGSEYYPGRTRTLRVRFDNDVPTLEIITPRAGQIVSSKQVRVSGLAPPGIKLQVNAKSVRVDGKGRFNATVPLDPADPRIVFRTQRGRRTAYYVRVLQYAPSSSRTN